MSVEQVSYTHINTNKGKPRLWIEGVKLAAAGFRRGLMYTLRETEDSILLLRDNDGKRKVSGRTRNNVDIPIIDLSGKMLADKFGQNSRVKVVFMENVIAIRKHHEDKNIETRETQIKKNVKAGKVNTATMCVGGGVSALANHQAAESLGIKPKTAWVVDYDLKYLQVAAKNNPVIDDDTVFIEAPVEEVEDKYYTKVDVLSVSLPCSGHSIAGKSKHKKTSIEHEGAASLFGLVRAIHAANPAAVVSENVVEAQDSAIYQLLCVELERLGYNVFHRVFEPEDTPTFERRRRYWFIALSKGLSEGFEFELPTFTPRDVKLAELLEETERAEAWAENQYLKDKAVRDKAAGKGFVRQLLTPESKSCGTIGRHYAKKRSTEPFLVRDEDTKERLLSPAEHARVKSIPEYLVSEVSATTAHQVLGQSIDFLQGLFTGQSLFKHLRKVSNV